MKYNPNIIIRTTTTKLISPSQTLFTAINSFYLPYNTLLSCKNVFTTKGYAGYGRYAYLELYLDYNDEFEAYIPIYVRLSNKDIGPSGFEIVTNNLLQLAIAAPSRIPITLSPEFTNFKRKLGRVTTYDSVVIDNNLRVKQ